MKYITCLKCKIKHKGLYNICKQYKLKDKFKEEYNEECYLEVLDNELTKELNKNGKDLLMSFTSEHYFMNNSKVYKIED